MRYLIYFFLFLLNAQLIAQLNSDAKRDFHWIFGAESWSLDTVDHIYLDFRTDSLTLQYRRVQGQNLFQTNASICDTAGNLLFYSNGCVIVDSGFQYLKGADTINRGVRWSYYCDRDNSDRTFGYGIVNGAWILPVCEYKYKIFYADQINSIAYSSGIRYSTLTNSSLTHAIYGSNIDQYLYQSNLNTRKPGYVRHANGRDWWHVNEAYSAHKFYIALIDSSDQVHPVKVQEFNQFPVSDFHGGGQACFTPDGTKFCSIDAYDQCQILDFDRCTGELSNPKYILLPVPYDSLFSITGIAISPNSRFMYLMTRQSIWQYDLFTSNIQDSKIKVAQYNGFLANGYSTSFYQSQLGPDGKIYIFPPGGRSTFSVIEQPDSIGLSCNVNQFKYYFPQWGLVAQPPRFPNFRLGPVVGSPCDTLTVSTFAPEPVKAQMVLRPNPATSHAVADMSVSDYSADMQLSLTVTDLSGSEVARYSVPPYAALQRIETEYLPNGVYFVALKSRGRVLRTEKLVVLRE
jgi:hypothetical protein